MNKKYNLLSGDLVLWGILALLALFSFFPVFSASSNLAYVVGKGTPWEYLFKHMVATRGHPIGFDQYICFREFRFVIFHESGESLGRYSGPGITREPPGSH